MTRLENRTITFAFGVAFLAALFGVSTAQIGPRPSSGGSPGGSTTQVQYNNAGAFGGDAGMTYNDSTNTLSLNNSSDTLTLGGTNQNIVANINALGLSFSLAGNNGTNNGGIFAAGALFQYTWQSTNRQDAGTVDTGIGRSAAGVFEIDNGTLGTYREAKLRSVVVGGTVPGISGCTAGTQTGGATAGTFTSGTTGACTVVLTFAFTAPTGWSCAANNQTTSNLIRQSASSTTTATIAGTTNTSDVVNFHCMAY